MRRFIIISFALFDILWGVLLFFSNSTNHYILFTNARGLQQVFASWQIVAGWLVVSGLLALLALRQTKKFQYLALMTPQILVVLSSLTSVIVAILNQQYGDGVLRGWEFIFLDQFPSLTLTAAYFLAIGKDLSEAEKWK